MTKEREYYLTKWQGGTDICEEDFLKKWYLAMRYIDKHTFSKACSDDEAVMKCACAVVDCLGKYDSIAAPEIAAESADDFSTTYRTTEDITKAKNEEIAEIIGLYLPRELLYRGLI